MSDLQKRLLGAFILMNIGILEIYLVLKYFL